jgi:Cytochrome C oxidase, cbb3-type, subunit III
MIFRTGRALVLTGLLLTASPAGAQMPDVARGRALYENHCVVCHSSAVHKRVNRIPVTRNELRDIVEHWQTQQKLQWSAQDVNDVVTYLGQSLYKF